MNSQKIREVTDWIAAHPQQIDDESFEYDTPAQAWFRFCNEPSLVNEYPRLDPGCDYIFRSGPSGGMKCGSHLEHGEKRCKFHQAFIFSDELRDYIADQHAQINGPPKKTEYKLHATQVGPGLYREIKRNLAIAYRDGVPRCVGYFANGSENMLTGLTPELKEYCQSICLAYTVPPTQ